MTQYNEYGREINTYFSKGGIRWYMEFDPVILIPTEYIPGSGREINKSG